MRAYKIFMKLIKTAETVYDLDKIVTLLKEHRQAGTLDTRRYNKLFDESVTRYLEI